MSLLGSQQKQMQERIQKQVTDQLKAAEEANRLIVANTEQMVRLTAEMTELKGMHIRTQKIMGDFIDAVKMTLVPPEVMQAQEREQILNDYDKVSMEAQNGTGNQQGTREE